MMDTFPSWPRIAYLTVFPLFLLSLFRLPLFQFYVHFSFVFLLPFSSFIYLLLLLLLLPLSLFHAIS